MALCILWLVTIDLLADAGVINEPGLVHGYGAGIAFVIAVLHDVAVRARSK